MLRKFRVELGQNFTCNGHELEVFLPGNYENNASKISWVAGREAIWSRWIDSEIRIEICTIVHRTYDSFKKFRREFESYG